MTLSNSLLARFWSYVDQKSTNECWPWMGSKMIRGGYGQIYEKDRSILAHRLSYFLANGEISVDKLVCHKCNNPQCVNPNHLYLGTYAQNKKDCVDAGRAYKFPIKRGSQHSRAKLTERAVREIRTNTKKPAELAKFYEVSEATICLIRQRKIWNHI